ncbi:hypothetical protein [Marinobacter sp. PE14]
MSVFIVREYWRFPVKSGEGVANHFYLDQDWGVWIDPLMIQVDRAFALERATTEGQSPIIDDEQAFHRLDWLETISDFTGAKRLQTKLEKVALGQPGELVRTFDQLFGVLGNGSKKH